MIGIRRFWDIGTERYHAERCFSQVYREVSNTFHEIAFEKVLDTDKKATSVEISFSSDLNSFAKKINYEEWSPIEQTTNISNIDGCIKKGKFETKLKSDSNVKIILLSWLKNKNTIRGMSLDSGFTKEIIFQFCNSKLESNMCKDFAKILFDARVWIIKRSTCKQYKTDDKEVCKERTTELE